MNSAGFPEPMMRELRTGAGAISAASKGTSDAGRARPHICFVSMDVYPILIGSTQIEFAGGGEFQQAMLARQLHRDGFPVSVLTGDYGQRDLVDSDGIAIYKVPAPAGRGLRGLRFLHPLMTDIVKTLSTIRPDIVYVRVAGFRAAASAWYARTRNRRFVYACASDREFQARDVSKLPRRDQWLFHLALRASDCVLVQNVKQKELYGANFRRHAELIPNCYTEEGVERRGPEGAVLWVGTFKPVKRPELFIELARRNPERQFVMVGGADNRNDPQQRYFESMRLLASGVANLRFTGYVPSTEVGSHFDEASLFVNTSDSEGFPNTFLQAWIRGIPTLSFVRPEVPAGQSGTIACRNLDELSERLVTLSSDTAAWQQASDRCFEHFSRIHSVESVIQGYRRIFDRLSGPGRVKAQP